MRYRHELKFEVSDWELELIRYRLMPLMQQDIHQENGAYTIRSLYFDDLYDSCMQENEDGVDNRCKYRLRIYNGSNEVIKLEKKSKFRGMTSKDSVSISEEACRAYMEGNISFPAKDAAAVEKELYSKIKMSGMRPKSIVEYERTAFVEPCGNVRITFDRNLSGTGEVQAFLNPEIAGMPLLETGRHVLEVKYDEFLPDHIAGVLEIGSLRHSSFSKYYYARKAVG